MYQTLDEHVEYNNLDNFNQIMMVSTEITFLSNPIEDDTISQVSNQQSALLLARAAILEDNFAENAFDENASQINSTFDTAAEDVNGLAGLPIKNTVANITSRCHNVSKKCTTSLFFIIKFCLFLIEHFFYFQLLYFFL